MIGERAFKVFRSNIRLLAEKYYGNFDDMFPWNAATDQFFVIFHAAGLFRRFADGTNDPFGGNLFNQQK